jgi:pilus assembly protein CpaC
MMFRRVTDQRNDIELLITVTPELVDAMNPHEVPRGGPGLNSMSPCDTEFYVHGHIEVPNLLGNDVNCNTNGYSVDGYSMVPPGVSSPSIYGAAGIPPGAIVPTEEPIVVGDGITVTAPTE